jgi:hypothetical protein
MADKYDEAVAYLTEHPEHISLAWSFQAPETAAAIKQAHCLFQHVTASGRSEWRNGTACGCLTTIRAEYGIAATDDLTTRIRGDARIPKLIDEVGPQHLHIMRDWQRRIDKELNREAVTA